MDHVPLGTDDYPVEDIRNINGVVGSFTTLRVTGRQIVYIFISEDAVKNCEKDMMTPPEAGITYQDPEMNIRRFPRLWLELLKAEFKVRKYVRKLAPEMEIEWINIVRTNEGRWIPT